MDVAFFVSAFSFVGNMHASPRNQPREAAIRYSRRID